MLCTFKARATPPRTCLIDAEPNHEAKIKQINKTKQNSHAKPLSKSAKERKKKRNKYNKKRIMKNLTILCVTFTQSFKKQQ